MAILTAGLVTPVSGFGDVVLPIERSAQESLSLRAFLMRGTERVHRKFEARGHPING